MGLQVYIFKTRALGGAGEWSNGGVSSRVECLTIVNIEGPSAPSPEAPAARLEPGAFKGTAIVVPCERPSGTRIGPMAGGTYVGASDSRFSEAVERMTGQRFYGLLALHDRFETPEQYNANFE